MFTLLFGVVSLIIGFALGYFIGNSKGVTNTIKNASTEVKDTIDTIKS